MFWNAWFLILQGHIKLIKSDSKDSYVTIYCYYIYIYTQGSKLTFLLGSTGAPNFKKLGAPKIF